jgi:hypothetical protein
MCLGSLSNIVLGASTPVSFVNTSMMLPSHSIGKARSWENLIGLPNLASLNGILILRFIIENLVTIFSS